MGHLPLRIHRFINQKKREGKKKKKSRANNLLLSRLKKKAFVGRHVNRIWSSKCKIRFHPFSEAPQSFTGISSDQTGPSQWKANQEVLYSDLNPLTVLLLLLVHVHEEKYDIFTPLNPHNLSTNLDLVIDIWVVYIENFDSNIIIVMYIKYPCNFCKAFYSIFKLLNPHNLFTRIDLAMDIWVIYSVLDSNIITVEYMKKIHVIFAKHLIVFL